MTLQTLICPYGFQSCAKSSFLMLMHVTVRSRCRHSCGDINIHDDSTTAGTARTQLPRTPEISSACVMAVVICANRVCRVSPVHMDLDLLHFTVNASDRRS